MPNRQRFVTVRDLRDSVWQSSVEAVARRDAGGPAAAIPNSVPDQGRLGALVAACHGHVFDVDQMRQGKVSAAALPWLTTPAAGAAPAVLSNLDTAKRCSWLALQLAQAKLAGAADRIATLQSEMKFSECDPFWADCITEYVTYFKIEGKAPSVRDGLDVETPGALPADAVVAIFGDWGTGTEEAIALMRQIQGFHPHLLLHLGDIYYSGTQDEVQGRFLGVCSTVFGAAMPACVSLCGNHDMYSGGQGYEGLLDKIGQPGSYVALRNDDWLFVAMDTGRSDCDPFNEGDVATRLVPDGADWVNRQVRGRGERKVVLFSHHPPFSAYDAIGGAAVNPLLLGQLQESLPAASAWFWGHEHRLSVYDAFQGVARGRCVGHAAVPVFADAQGDPAIYPEVPVHLVDGKPLEMGAQDGEFKHGFAIMTLAGKDATVSYYRLGESAPMWQETF